MGIADFLVERFAAPKVREAEITKEKEAMRRLRDGDYGLSDKSFQEMTRAAVEGAKGAFGEGMEGFRRTERAQGPFSGGRGLAQQRQFTEALGKVAGQAGTTAALHSSDVAKQQKLLDEETVRRRGERIKAMFANLLPGVGTAFGSVRGGKEAGALGAGGAEEPEKASYMGVGIGGGGGDTKS
jgi:hypothetical protein